MARKVPIETGLEMRVFPHLSAAGIAECARRFVVNGGSFCRLLGA
jgi:hypothetical protein